MSIDQKACSESNESGQDLVSDVVKLTAVQRELLKAGSARQLVEADELDWRSCFVYLAFVYSSMGDDRSGSLLCSMLERKGVLDSSTAAKVLSVLVERDYFLHGSFVAGVFLQRLKELHSKGGLSGCETALREYIDRNDAFWASGREPLKWKLTAAKLLGVPGSSGLPFQTSDVGWVEDIKSDYSLLSEAEQQLWVKLVSHGLTASGSAPSKKWLKEAGALIGELRHEVSATLVRWFSIVCNYKFSPEEENEAIIKALIWVAGVCDAKELAGKLGDMAVAFYTKVPQMGPRSRVAGNACIQVLCLLGASGVVQLSRLRSVIKYSQGKSLIEKSVVKAAEVAGLSPDDVEEAAIPDMGFNLGGEVSLNIAGCTVLMRLTGGGRLTSQWLDAQGKSVKAVPASVKRDAAEAYKSWQRQFKEYGSVISGQRNRMEQSYIRQRCWAYEQWRERFVDSHELLGWMGKRLIWNIHIEKKSFSVMWKDGELCDVGGNPVLVGNSQAAKVTLWHPVQAEPQEVLAWRERIAQSKLVQPIRQAYREIYVSSCAEGEPDAVLQKFSGHLLRQFQLNALLQERGWSYSLQGAWDGDNNPLKELANWGVGVEFEVVPKKEFLSAVGTTGAYAYLESGGFGFHSLRGECKRLALSEVPPLLFSEVLRDLDLFVAVCSVANDPDLGLVNDPEFGRYMSSALCGSLDGMAIVRRDVLADILSRLSIAKRCKFEGCYLVVAGDLHTYRIHLGSSGVLVDGDKYLCLVSGEKKKSSLEGVYLPFEGDAVLELILSKAFLLAEDKKIKDPLILKQISL
ncbi:DUF4132 domain-containing protein [Atopomonas hussainii]|uniref:DUF4132 domain-containing protein n=1 Tax=Atopomonas hussainii TaxID=1429083 RepID=UPI0009003B92|nr:DUF4132 domain-containing protein [Atopomonas hussainii]